MRSPRHSGDICLVQKDGVNSEIRLYLFKFMDTLEIFGYWSKRVSGHRQWPVDLFVAD